MRSIERVSIIGAGGIGAAYASKLYDMDSSCVRIITNSERYERYSAKGFVINGKKYEFEYVKPEQDVEYADLVLVSVKYHHLQQAVKDMRKHIGPDTIILSLLNGISSEKIIGDVYGMDKMLYGMVLGIDAIRQGNNISYADTAKIYFGEESNISYSDKVMAVKTLFDKANIAYIIPDNMLRTLWWKFMFNAGINQTSAVLGASYKVFQTVKEAKELLRDAMYEVVCLSKLVGINLYEKDIDDFVALLNTLSPEGKTSMLQDIEAGRKTEVEMLAGTVCELGQRYGMDTPVNRTLLNIIKTLEKTY